MGETTFTQLIAPGVTAAIPVGAINKHVFQVKVASIDTSVDVNIEGSLDGTNYFSFKATDVQYTADGTYLIEENNIQVNFVRFRFVSELTLTTATIDVVYLGTA